MKIMVTGATGFIGQHLVTRLLRDGHSVIAVARQADRARAMPWFSRVSFVACDLKTSSTDLLRTSDTPDVLIHLAWPGLPNYKDFFHISDNLPSDLAFLEAAIKSGIKHVVVTGTCLEYGMQHGPLLENAVTMPHTPYGFAKDALRKSLQLLQGATPFTLQWMRLFYMYGDGQNPNSLLAHLDRAIDQGDAVFNMSAGNQLRDYLAVEDVADNIAMAMLHAEDCNGVINCCSGRPTSVVDLVQQRCAARSSAIRLNRGFFPYPDYEPMAFWGQPTKLNALRATLSSH